MLITINRLVCHLVTLFSIIWPFLWKYDIDIWPIVLYSTDQYFYGKNKEQGYIKVWHIDFLYQKKHKTLYKFNYIKTLILLKYCNSLQLHVYTKFLYNKNNKNIVLMHKWCQNNKKNQKFNWFLTELMMYYGFGIGYMEWSHIVMIINTQTFFTNITWMYRFWDIWTVRHPSLTTIRFYLFWETVRGGAAA